MVEDDPHIHVFSRAATFRYDEQEHGAVAVGTVAPCCNWIGGVRSHGKPRRQQQRKFRTSSFIAVRRGEAE